MRAKALKVKAKDVYKIRRYLIKKDLIFKNLKFLKYKKFVYIPVKTITPEINSYQITEQDFQIIKKKPKSYKDLISLPKNIIEKLPTSYDIIGNIILIKIPLLLLKYKKQIGKALLEANKNIKTVCLSYPISGELRTRKIEVIAGQNNTKTSHFEYGVKYELDIKKTYFSPRLANERKRIADQINKGETIVDMFTGIAPFSIIIAKYSNPKIIYAIDKNKDAIKYAKQNIKANKLLDKIELVNADAKEVKDILNKKGVKADRIIMNLPFSSYLFFKNALNIASRSCMIHYYNIVKEENIEKRVNSLKKISEKQNFKLVKLNVKKIKTYAPRVFYIGIDITAQKIDADVA